MPDKIQSCYGFTKMPFGRDLAPAQLHRHHGHAETVARLTWAITTIGNQLYQNVLNDPLRETCAA